MPFPSGLGFGTLKIIVGTDPAANVELNETVPAGKYWRLLGLNVALTTSATVANRTVRFLFDDGNAANVFYKQGSRTAQTASLTWDYSFTTGESSAQNANVVGLALPEGFWLGPGYRIRTSIANIDPGDNWAAPVLQVVEYTLNPF